MIHRYMWIGIFEKNKTVGKKKEEKQCCENSTAIYMIQFKTVLDFLNQYSCLS